VKQICSPFGDHESSEDDGKSSAVFDRLQVPDVRRFAVPREAEMTQM